MTARRPILTLAIVALCVAIPVAVARGGKAHPIPDRRVQNGIHAIQVGIQKYAADNNDTYPSVAAVSKEGAVGAYVDKWPTNPWTRSPMVSSTKKGDYTYTLRVASTSYSLSGHLSTGSDFTVP